MHRARGGPPVTASVDPPLPLAGLLTGISREVSGLAAMTLRAEGALHDILDDMPRLPSEVGRDLQQIDLVRQSLEDLSRLLGALAEIAPAEARLASSAVHRNLRLGSIAARLTGASPVDRPGSEGDNREVDLF